MIIAMTRREQVEAVAHAAGITARQARDALDAVGGIVVAGLLESERVTLGGVGTFVVKRRSPRRVTNPATGVPMDLPASAAVAFRPAGELRKIVNDRWS